MTFKDDGPGGETPSFSHPDPAMDGVMISRLVTRYLAAPIGEIGSEDLDPPSNGSVM